MFADVLAHSTAAVPATAGAGGLGAVLLLVLLVRADAELVPWPLACLGTAYAVALVVAGRAVDNAAPLVAVGLLLLLLCGELAAWSIDERLRIPEERAVVRARALALAALALGSLAVAALLVALTASPAGGGLAWTALGAASAVAVVALAVGLVRRAPLH